MTLRTWRRLFVAGFVIVLLQVGLFQQIMVLGAHPDLWLLTAICAGLVGGPQYGAVVGFVTGLVADIFLVTPFGLSSLCYLLVAFAVGQTAALPGGRAPYTFRVAATFVASAGGTLLYAGLAILIGQPHVPRAEFVDVLIVVSVANAILAIPGVAVMRWVFTGPGLAGRERELATVGSR
ncbi:MAG: rod shape-determining protein MreD [Acidimicrobiales bacterium]